MRVPGGVLSLMRAGALVGAMAGCTTQPASVQPEPAATLAPATPPAARLAPATPPTPVAVVVPLPPPAPPDPPTVGSVGVGLATEDENVDAGPHHRRRHVTGGGFVNNHANCGRG